jgi:hypothetical protein
VQCHEQPDAF